MKLIAFLTEFQLAILKKLFGLTFVLLFFNLAYGLLMVLLLALGLIEEGGYFFDLQTYFFYLFVFVFLISFLAMSVYGACYIRYLSAEVGKGIAVYGIVIFLIYLTAIGFWWFYLREIRGKEPFPERKRMQ